MSRNRQKRVESAQTKVVLRLPFWAPGLLRLPVEFCDDGQIGTAATDGKRIIWEGAWFDSLPDEVLPTVLCHEVAHCLLGHLWRAPVGSDHRTWNIAIDHATNLMLKEFSAQVIAKGMADPFPFPEPADAYCCDPQFTGWAEERIYAHLASQRPPGGVGSKAGSKQGGGSAGGGGQGSGKSNKTRPGANGGVGNPPQPHSMPDFGQVLESGPGQAPDKKLAQDWESTLIQSVTAAKSRGTVPGDLERLVQGLVSPKVNWWDILRSWLREQCADDWDFLTPALEWSGSEFILPSLRSEKMGAVVFGSDWSGSTCGLVDTFHAEKQACLDDLRPAKLVDIGFDTVIGWEREYVPGDTIAPEVKCGGGTDFRDFFRRCEEMQPQPRCVVVMTDCDGTMPDTEPPFPVIFICYGDAVAPFGLTIKASDL